MQHDQIKEVVTKHLGRIINISPETIDTSRSMKELGANSLDIVEVVSNAMRELRIRIPRNELDQLKNVDGLIGLLAKHSQAKAAL